MKKVLTNIIGRLLVWGLSLAVWVARSPKPVIWIARKTFFPLHEDERPNQYTKEGVTIETNINYPSKYAKNQFDFYHAVSPHAENPTILWVHGGGFIGGDKCDIEEYSMALAKRGYHVISMNYELAPEAIYPAPLIQLGELLMFLKENKGKWNLDNLFLAGDSAGAQIISQFVNLQTDSDYAGSLDIKPTFNTEKIRGMLLFCGAYDVEALTQSDSALINVVFSNIGWAYLGTKNWKGSNQVNSASIINFVNKDFPSSYITDGNTLSFENQSRDLVVKLNSLGISVKSRFFKVEEFITQHVFHFDLKQEASKLVFEDVMNFLEQFRK